MATKAKRGAFLAEWNRTPSAAVQSAIDNLHEPNADISGVPQQSERETLPLRLVASNDFTILPPDRTIEPLMQSRTFRSALSPFVVGALLLASSTPSLAQDEAPLRATPDGRPLVLTFADEFDIFRRFNGRSGVWRTTYGDGTHLGLDRRSLPTNGELELYVDPDIRGPQGSLGLNPFAIRNGILEIVAVPTPPELKPLLRNYPYMSGLITTQPSFSQTYGYFEMRAKLPRGKGLWPAFWLLPADLSWPPEIDVMESIGDPSHVYLTTHSQGADNKSFEHRISGDDFHTFAVSWDERDITWYIDGRRAGSKPTPRDIRKPMFMLANLGVGGHWPGSPDATTRFPATYSIDYIRAYRFAR